jgi:adenylosuccinate synthase
MPATVVVGAQWGDEGKGKIVDLLAGNSDVVCRYQGGPNAGHTIIREGERFALHHIPSGIISGAVSVIGAGCVVNPEQLVAELDGLEGRGISTSRLHLSGNAHLIMPWHLLLDGASEKALGKLQIGTTRRGIGPAYADKAARVGVRVQDLLDPAIMRKKIELALIEKNAVLERIFDLAPLDSDKIVADLIPLGERLSSHIVDASLLVDAALRDNKRVLLEGAQGTLLDLDHGTYPYVTSSNPLAGSAATGVGIGPTRIDGVIGVAKAYITRVGEGPFPTQIEGADQERVRELGQEFGTTTGRERRCGWLDLVALRFAARVNGLTSLAITKIDVLSTFAELPVCTTYRLPDGSTTREFPAHQSDFHGATPVYEQLPGWQTDVENITSLADLPKNARDYLAFIEEHTEVPVTVVGTGPGREQVIVEGGLDALLAGGGNT